jgi:diaminobutyrate-2-oxoglutarate transaminase
VLRQFGVLLIVDDIQVGCGRTGPFFSFEAADLEPDIVCLSKSLSGYGLPLAVTLLKPELDLWEPGKHNGTFRGHNLAFVTATAALDHFWSDTTLADDVRRRSKIVRDHLDRLACMHGGKVRGRGLIQGIAFDDIDAARTISRAAFEQGVVVETAGRQDEVLKILPPLTIPDEELVRGLEIIGRCSEHLLVQVGGKDGAEVVDS